MKRIFGILLAVCMLLTACCALAEYTSFADVLTFYRGVDINISTAKIPVRTGPSTEFTERATYTLKHAKAISMTNDNKGTEWVQIEFKYNGQITRGYTTARQFRTANGLPRETVFSCLGDSAMCCVYSGCRAQTGPGWEYMQSDDFNLYPGETYWLVAQENGWGLVQTADTGYPMWRGWVQLSNLIY